MQTKSYHNSKSPENQMRIAVSRCLLGDVVRYDAQKKRDHFIADTLGRHFSWSPICPEVEIGLGVPRPKIQLEHVVEDKAKNAGVDFRLTMPEKNRDLTRKMLGHCRRLVRQLKEEGVCGCLLKSRSPSCGMSRVKAYMSDGRMRRDGVGFFAATVQKMLPELPVEEDERFGDAAVRENWIERVFAYDRLQRLFAGPCKPADLEAFHRAHRLALQSHDPKAHGQLSRLLESPRNARLTAGLQRQYASALMAAMRRPATRAKHAAVLRGILAALEGQLDAQTYRHLTGLAAEYRQGRRPLAAVIVPLGHFAEILDVAELCDQTYLRPTVAELTLRNHA